ncbi:methyl-accepting chemotaxis protein [Paracidovorax valerianellae]|uniref:Methyl-accepting chemotaxis sensory transducer with Cache sensor n=1 Tax=Paracidovorax valerianellae TaxID=187868 RepID=A0A1G6YBN9_9BURK|nr:methyl-accepting chemotaxis protein [Paracidovorax valerianellae]MDA8445802.1 methyl-accepting chemotaxis protein [Paracidovorax valerianellae]SDD87788.1 methyl-accepting chemotaxis sensory transducer with Cache sensor [Paracidovorax valerianellae]
MKKLTLRQKLWLPLVLALLGLLALTFVNAWQTRQIQYDSRQSALADITDMALTVISDYEKQAQAGKMSQEEARSAALARVASQRYGKDGYVTVIGADSIMAMHPIKAELNGKNMIGFKDAKGNLLYVNIAATGASAKGRGFLEYWWPRPGSDAPSPKIGYVVRFKPWNWDLVAGDYVDDIEQAFRSSLYRAIGLLALLGLVISALTGLVVRDIERSVGGEPRAAAGAAMRMADGDLQADIPLRANDEHSLMYAIGFMRDRLASILHRIQQATSTIDHAASEIAQGNGDLSRRTEQQASSLQQTASSMEELTATVRQNADNARQAAQYVSSTAQTAVQGGQVVNQVVETMRSISASSRKINEIIGVIDGIAFQTNILALNAAVEAARAGEQGRGFAVVASEVRGLAQRSAAAAKEIKTLISESVNEVHTGSELVEKAGKTMGEVVESVHRISGLMEGIASANVQQTAGIEEVNRAVSQMDEMTQQNAAMVEEASAATSAMASQVAVLREALAVFQLSEATLLAAERHAPAPAPTASLRSATNTRLIRA